MKNVNVNVEKKVCELVEKYNIKVKAVNVAKQETLDKILAMIEAGKVKERVNKNGKVDLDIIGDDLYVVFVETVVKDFSKTSGLKVNGRYANLGATDKQVKTLKMFVYNYKVTINTDCLKSRATASEMITKINQAIKEGKLKQRNPKRGEFVESVNGVYTLVKKTYINSSNDYINGFDKFNQEDNIKRYA